MRLQRLSANILDITCHPLNPVAKKIKHPINLLILINWGWLVTIEEVLQISLMIAAVLLAIFTIEVKNILHAVIGFCAMCVAIGGIFWLLAAPYVSVFQILIYAGAVVGIFLAAVMLTTSKETTK